MKQVEQNYRSGALRLIDAPVPMPQPGQALVRTRVSLISAGTEKQIMTLARASLAGKAAARPDLVRQTLRKARNEGILPTVQKVLAKLDTPIPLGYSLAGEVVDLNGDSPYRVGERIACAGAAVANHAEYNVVPKNLSVPIPAGVDDEDASFVTLGAIALQGVRVAAPTLGETVLVTGLGLIGQLTVQLLKANGCRVIAFDPVASRAELAAELGADVAVSSGLKDVVASATGGHGADAVIVTASTKSSAPLNEAAELSRLKGRVVVVGLVGMAIDREPFYKRELDLRLSMSYGPGRHDPAYEQEGHDYPLAYVRWTEGRNMAAFLDLVAQGRVTPKKLVTHRFPIERAEDAYALLDTDEPYLAVLLTYAEPAPVVRSVPVSPPKAATGSGIGFIGFGNYAKGVLLPAVRKAKPAPALHTVVTATSLSARAAADSAGFANAATDPAELFGDPAIGSIFVTTRHDSHAALTLAALQAGKNVFVEKPLALTHADIDRIADAARDSGAILTVGFNRRFAPMTEALVAALRPRAGPLVMTYRINAGHIPRDSWVHGPQGGGRIAGEVCHFVDLLSAICGADPVQADGVTAQGLDDSLAATLRFADGSVGTIAYSSIGDPSVPKEAIEVFAPGIVARIDDFSQLTIVRGGKEKRSKASQDKGQARLVAAFLQAASTGGQPPIALDTLLAVSRITLDLAGVVE